MLDEFPFKGSTGDVNSGTLNKKLVRILVTYCINLEILSTLALWFLCWRSRLTTLTVGLDVKSLSANFLFDSAIWLILR